jgi:hypothetical protein
MVRRTRAEMEETRATLLATGRQFLKNMVTLKPRWMI